MQWKKEMFVNDSSQYGLQGLLLHLTSAVHTNLITCLFKKTFRIYVGCCFPFAVAHPLSSSKNEQQLCDQALFLDVSTKTNHLYWIVKRSLLNKSNGLVDCIVESFVANVLMRTCTLGEPWRGSQDWMSFYAADCTF